MTKSSVAKVMTQTSAPSRLSSGLPWHAMLLAAQPWALTFGLSWIQICVLSTPLLARQRSSHRLDENSLSTAQGAPSELGELLACLQTATPISQLTPETSFPCCGSWRRPLSAPPMHLLPRSPWAARMETSKCSWY